MTETNYMTLLMLKVTYFFEFDFLLKKISNE